MVDRGYYYTSMDVPENIKNSNTIRGLDFIGVNAQHELTEEPNPEDEPSSRSESVTDKYYDMKYEKLGTAMIFNEKSSHSNNDDCARLKGILTKMRFKVFIHDKLSLPQELKQLNKYKNYFENSACFLLVVKGSLSPNILWNHFTPDKCPSLTGKPKIFIMDSCRGGEVDKVMADQEKNSRDGSENKGRTDTIPLRSDFLFVYSTIPVNGCEDASCCYIKSLCKELERINWQTHTFDNVLTLVNRRMALYYESRGEKQTSSVTNLLTRILKFPLGPQKNKNKIYLSSEKSATMTNGATGKP